MAIVEAALKELEGLVEIYTDLKFKKDDCKNELNVYFTAQLNLHELEGDVIIAHDQHSFKIDYFPPVYLQSTLQEDAQTHRLVLDCCWLSADLIRKLEEKLQTFILPESDSILWNMFQFLENETLVFLFACHRDNLTIDISNLLSDTSRDSIGDLYEILKDFNSRQLKYVFDNSIFTCSACLVSKRGRNCIEIETCRHVFCLECASEYYNVQIKNGVLELNCLTCGVPLHYDEVKSVLTPDAFERWDQLTRDQCLRREQACKPCPRCATLVITVQDEYGICTRCRFPFCARCNKTYHGPGYCPKDFEIATKRAEDELKEKIKRCPCCKEGYDKLGGCNKMTCANCGQFFCFLCNKILDKNNPYMHFGLRPKCFL